MEEKTMENNKLDNHRRDKLDLKILDFIASITAKLEEQQATIESLNSQLSTIYSLLTPETIAALNDFVTGGGVQLTNDLTKIKTLLNTSFTIPAAYSIN